MNQAKPIRTLLFSTLYPSSVRPGHGIFVETRLRELLKSGQVQTKVVAPVPWFFSNHPRYGDYARMASTPGRETHHDIDVLHPRYFLPPKVGMKIAPLTLAIGAIPAIHRLLEEGFDFDLIDAHYYYPDGVAAALLARYFNKPFTVTARGSDINLLPQHTLPRKLIQWAAKRAQASIGVSAALTQAMVHLGVPSSALMTMPNGVDLTQFDIQPQAACRTALGWPEVATLLFVGNLVENKGPRIAVEALAQLPQFRLVIAGEGPQRPALEALVLQHHLTDRVQFLGRVEHDQLAQCYSAADILVLPSAREGWPNVLLESMACGTPVVATQVGGIPEIVHAPEAGRLMPERSAASLVQAAADLMQHTPTRAAVRACALGCGWHSTTAAQVQLFRQIAARQQGQAHA
jgi:teichuronic acid biosynthesis glycosyltransferase TuaC